VCVCVCVCVYVCVCWAVLLVEHQFTHLCSPMISPLVSCWYSFMHGIRSLADNLYRLLHSAPSIYCVPHHSWTKATYQNRDHVLVSISIFYPWESVKREIRNNGITFYWPEVKICFVLCQHDMSSNFIVHCSQGVQFRRTFAPLSAKHALVRVKNLS